MSERKQSLIIGRIHRTSSNGSETTENKKAHTFITFDICDFYPSITEELLDKALDFASYHTEATEDDKVIIKHIKNYSLQQKRTMV